MLHELLPWRSAGRSMPAIQCNNIYIYMYIRICMHRSLPVMRRSRCPRIASPINFVSCAAWMKESCSRPLPASILSDAPRTQGWLPCFHSRVICMRLLIHRIQTKLPSRPGTKAAKYVDFRCAATASFRCATRCRRQLSHCRHAHVSLMILPSAPLTFDSGLLLKQSAATTACAVRTRRASPACRTAL